MLVVARLLVRSIDRSLIALAIGQKAGLGLQFIPHSLFTILIIHIFHTFYIFSRLPALYISSCPSIITHSPSLVLVYHSFPYFSLFLLSPPQKCNNASPFSISKFPSHNFLILFSNKMIPVIYAIPTKSTYPLFKIQPVFIILFHIATHLVLVCALMLISCFFSLTALSYLLNRTTRGIRSNLSKFIPQTHHTKHNTKYIIVQLVGNFAATSIQPKSFTVRQKGDHKIIDSLP